MPISAILILMFACMLLWVGSGMVIQSVIRFSHKLGLSSFSLSFIVLGMLTSLPEISVGFQSVQLGRPAIFMGNLLGGVIGLFLLVIPLLAVLGNGIVVRHQFTGKTDLLFALVVIGAPALLLVDGGINQIEALLLIIMYCALIVKTWQERSALEHVHAKTKQKVVFGLKDFIKVSIGVALIVLASHITVKELLELSQSLRLDPFIVTVLALSFGTNLPELSLAIRSAISRKKDVAFGDYLGSAAANTVLFGMFTIMDGQYLSTTAVYTKTSIFIAISLILFLVFSRSGRKITRNEGLLMLATYGLFLYTELH